MKATAATAPRSQTGRTSSSATNPRISRENPMLGLTPNRGEYKAPANTATKLATTKAMPRVFAGLTPGTADIGGLLDTARRLRPTLVLKAMTNAIATAVKLIAIIAMRYEG